jgi:hypothetical protein
MKIKDNDIIFLCILLVFGNITNNINEEIELKNLHNYKNNNIEKIKYTKITKFLYTSQFNSNNIYITLKIPLNNYTYYNSDDLTIHTHTFKFILNYLFYYINNDYLSSFYRNTYILFIIDNEQTIQIIKKMQIINLDSFYSNEINSILDSYIYFNTYELPWMKYLGHKQQIMLIVYLCLFSKYNNNCNIYYLNNTQINILKYLEYFIKSNSSLKNKHNDNRVPTIVKLIKNINIQYHALNFRYLSIIFCTQICDKYINHNIICKDSKTTNSLLLNNYYILFKSNVDKHKKKYKCLIGNNVNPISNSNSNNNKSKSFNSISLTLYNKPVINDVFL